MITTDPIVFALQASEQRAAERTAQLSRAAIAGDVELLAALLERAKIAHTKFEEGCGPDEDWAKWYAEYMLGVR